MENKQPEGKHIAQSPLFKRFLNKAELYLKHPMEVTKLLNAAFQKASHKKNIGALAVEVWESLQLLSRMIKAAVSGDYKGIPKATVIGGIAVFIYFLSPIDLIPDIIPVIGFLDDASLLAWFMASIKTELDRFKDWEATKKVEEKHLPHTDPVHHADSSFGTPKFSDQPAGEIRIDQHKNT